MRTIRLLTVAAIFASAQSVSFAQRPASSAQTVGDPLDINTASPQQLKALPGFGDAYVRRVIAGRPYTAKNQLLTRGVLPQSAYDQIASRIVAHRPPK
jgi:competence protein ComEA